MKPKTPSKPTNTDFTKSAEFERFLKFCNDQKVNFKLIYEDQQKSCVEGPMANSRAQTILRKNEELFSMKPLPPLPVNYKGLYADQNKMCSYASEIVKMNSTSGQLGEGIYFIYHLIFHFLSQISSHRELHYLSNSHSSREATSEARQTSPGAHHQGHDDHWIGHSSVQESSRS